MPTTTYRTTLNCGGCVAKVRPLLDATPGVAAWSVDTADPAKLLTVTGDAPPAAVAAAVERGGFKVLGTVPAAPTVTTVREAPAAAAYYPLLLVVLFVAGAAALVEVNAGSFVPMRAMNTFMGGFFVAFSFFKLLDVPAFAGAFRRYDLVAAAVPGYATAYPFVELLLGVAFLTGTLPVPTNVATLALMLVGAAGVGRTLWRRETIQCACLGTVFNLPMSAVTLVENGTMAVMAAAMLWWMW